MVLARALYRRPKLLVLDEATSHLDTKRERFINEVIKNFDLTRLIIAHREESIKNAARVIVMPAMKLESV